MCNGSQGVKGFQFKQETRQGAGDDTAANALRLICEDDSVLMADNDGPWGDWSEIVKCPANNVICGLRVQLHLWVGAGDDTVLNNVDFMCCEINSKEITNPQGCNLFFFLLFLSETLF